MEAAASAVCEARRSSSSERALEQRRRLLRASAACSRRFSTLLTLTNCRRDGSYVGGSHRFYCVCCQLHAQGCA